MYLIRKNGLGPVLYRVSDGRRLSLEELTQPDGEKVVWADRPDGAQVADIPALRGVLVMGQYRRSPEGFEVQHGLVFRTEEIEWYALLPADESTDTAYVLSSALHIAECPAAAVFPLLREIACAYSSHVNRFLYGKAVETRQQKFEARFAPGEINFFKLTSRTNAEPGTIGYKVLSLLPGYEPSADTVLGLLRALRLVEDDGLGQLVRESLTPVHDFLGVVRAGDLYISESKGLVANVWDKDPIADGQPIEGFTVLGRGCYIRTADDGHTWIGGAFLPQELCSMQRDYAYSNFETDEVLLASNQDIVRALRRTAKHRFLQESLGLPRERPVRVSRVPEPQTPAIEGHELQGNQVDSQIQPEVIPIPQENSDDGCGMVPAVSAAEPAPAAEPEPVSTSQAEGESEVAAGLAAAVYEPDPVVSPHLQPLSAPPPITTAAIIQGQAFEPGSGPEADAVDPVVANFQKVMLERNRRAQGAEGEINGAVSNAAVNPEDMFFHRASIRPGGGINRYAPQGQGSVKETFFPKILENKDLLINCEDLRAAARSIGTEEAGYQEFVQQFADFLDSSRRKGIALGELMEREDWDQMLKTPLFHRALTLKLKNQ